MKQDKEIGTLLLDGDVFQIGSFETLAGGCVKPYGNRKPVLLRSYQKIKRSGNNINNGYWTAKVKGYGAQDYIFLDGNSIFKVSSSPIHILHDSKSSSLIIK